MQAVAGAATGSAMPQIPRWLAGVAAAMVAIVLLAGTLLVATLLLIKLHAETWLSLPVVAILGVLLLLTTLAAVSVAFGHFGLSDKAQALALPEGSIRAVLALSLVIIFAILTVFLYGTLAAGTLQSGNVEIKDFDRAAFLRNNPSVKDVVLISEASSKDNPPIKTTTVALVMAVDPAGVDFGKQLLTLIGTLMTAVTAFYFGAKTATSAASAAGGPAKPALTLRSISPATRSRAEGPFALTIAGDNLNTVTSVKLVLGNAQIDATDVHSNPNSVVCTVPVNPTTAAGAWDVVVVDGDTRSEHLPAALTLT
jgi:hypothetical protein